MWPRQVLMLLFEQWDRHIATNKFIYTGPELVGAGLETLNYWIKLTNCTTFIRNQTIAGNSYDFEARRDSVTYKKFMMHILCVGWLDYQ